MTKQNSFIPITLSVLLVLSALADAPLRMTGFPAALVVQFLTMILVLFFVPLPEKIPGHYLSLSVIIMVVVLAYFAIETVLSVGDIQDRLGMAIRCLTFARVLISINSFTLTPRTIFVLCDVIIFTSFVTILFVRATDFPNSIRIEALLLPFAVYMYRLKDEPLSTASFWPITKVLICMILILLTGKSSLILAMGGVVLVFWPVISIAAAAVGTIALIGQSIAPDLAASILPERIFVRLQIILSLSEGFDRKALGIITSNRSEEYIYVLYSWIDSGIPIFGDGLSSLIYVESKDIWRSTMHNLLFNVFRVFGVFAILFYLALIMVGVSFAKTNRIWLGIYVGLFIHNLLTFSLFASTLFAFIVLIQSSYRSVEKTD